MTLPKTTESTILGSTLPASKAEAAATWPKTVGDISFSFPPNVPKAVLFAATINTGLASAILDA